MDPYQRREQRLIQAQNALTESLILTVPLIMHRLKNEWEDTLQVIASEAAAVVATTGDAILFSSDPKTKALAFQALATGIAAKCLFMPDGVVFLGHHYKKDMVS